MKFAAIDVGSNAIRLLFAQVFERKDGPFFKKDSLFRVPIRLGKDAFVKRKISDEKADSLIKTMIAFKYLIEAYNPLDYMATATAAMREAENSHEIANAIYDETKLDLQIIDGQREAEIIYSNHVAEQLDNKGNYLYIDVGGGSTGRRCRRPQAVRPQLEPKRARVLPPLRFRGCTAHHHAKVIAQ